MKTANNPYVVKQLREYGQDGIDYCNASLLIKKYLERKAVASENSANTYRGKLWRFAYFVYTHYDKTPLDDFIEHVKQGKPDPLDVLADFASYLTKIKNKPNEVNQKVKRVRKFLRFCGVKIDIEDFKDKVTLPRREWPEFEGTEKAQIVELLDNCVNQRLKTAMLLFAATGCRSIEGCAVTNSNIDFAKNTITFPAQYTKMRRERTRPMTAELAKQLHVWLKVKYRKHQTVDAEGKRLTVTPKPHPDDLVLAYWHYIDKPSPRGINITLHHEYHELANRLGMGRKNGRRVITFHSLRRYAKTAISDQGYADFSEWFIGHQGSTYYRKSEKERLEHFKKIESVLTFADTSAMEAKHRDVSSQLEASQAQLRDLQDTVAMLVEAQKEREELEKHKKEIERIAIEEEET